MYIYVYTYIRICTVYIYYFTEDCSIIIPEKCLVSCQKLNLIHMKLTSNQLATLLKGIGKDKAMKEVHLSRCIQTKVILNN